MQRLTWVSRARPARPAAFRSASQFWGRRIPVVWLVASTWGRGCWCRGHGLATEHIAPLSLDFNFDGIDNHLIPSEHDVNTPLSVRC